jgi:predicted nuclease of predicted toxin-antitoxin system
MNLLIDESVDRHVVDKLRQDSHNVVYVSEMDPGISDDVVLSIANNMGALLLTADKDFGELVFRRQQISAGVLLIRLAGLSQEAKVNWSPRWCRNTLQNFPERSASFHPE